MSQRSESPLIKYQMKYFVRKASLEQEVRIPSEKRNKENEGAWWLCNPYELQPLWLSNILTKILALVSICKSEFLNSPFHATGTFSGTHELSFLLHQGTANLFPAYSMVSTLWWFWNCLGGSCKTNLCQSVHHKHPRWTIRISWLVFEHVQVRRM